MTRDEAKKVYIKHWVRWVNTTFAVEPYKEEDFDEEEGSFKHIFEAVMEAAQIGFDRGVDAGREALLDKYI